MKWKLLRIMDTWSSVERVHHLGSLGCPRSASQRILDHPEPIGARPVSVGGRGNGANATLRCREMLPCIFGSPTVVLRRAEHTMRARGSARPPHCPRSRSTVFGSGTFSATGVRPAPDCGPPWSCPSPARPGLIAVAHRLPVRIHSCDQTKHRTRLVLDLSSVHRFLATRQRHRHRDRGLVSVQSHVCTKLIHDLLSRGGSVSRFPTPITTHASRGQGSSVHDV